MIIILLKNKIEINPSMLILLVVLLHLYVLLAMDNCNK